MIISYFRRLILMRIIFRCFLKLAFSAFIYCLMDTLPRLRFSRISPRFYILSKAMPRQYRLVQAGLSLPSAAINSIGDAS